MKSKLTIGDTVWTNVQMYFVEASNPVTGAEIETRFHRGQNLTVVAVNEKENTIDVQLADGFVATIDRDNVNGVDD